MLHLNSSSESMLLHFATTFDSFLLTAMSLRSLGVEQHCRCIQTESRFMARLIEKVEIILPNSHCEETEIM